MTSFCPTLSNNHNMISRLKSITTQKWYIYVNELKEIKRPDRNRKTDRDRENEKS